MYIFENFWSRVTFTFWLFRPPSNKRIIYVWHVCTKFVRAGFVTRSTWQLQIVSSLWCSPHWLIHRLHDSAAENSAWQKGEASFIMEMCGHAIHEAKEIEGRIIEAHRSQARRIRGENKTREIWWDIIVTAFAVTEYAAPTFHWGARTYFYLAFFDFSS